MSVCCGRVTSTNTRSFFLSLSESNSVSTHSDSRIHCGVLERRHDLRLAVREDRAGLLLRQRLAPDKGG